MSYDILYDAVVIMEDGETDYMQEGFDDPLDALIEALKWARDRINLREVYYNGVSVVAVALMEMRYDKHGEQVSSIQLPPINIPTKEEK